MGTQNDADRDSDGGSESGRANNATGSSAGSTSPPRDLVYSYRFDNVEFDEHRRELRVDGELRNLEPRPLDVLAELLRRPNEVVTRAELIEALWDNRPTVNNVLSNAVNKLRLALCAPATRRIVTVPRIGYRFDGPIQRTVVGRADLQTLDLHAGQPVSSEPDYVLKSQLGSSPRHAVWLARNRRSGDERVFKFAAHSESLLALKREWTLCRTLEAALGPRNDLPHVLAANLAQPPFYLAFQHWGEDMLAWSRRPDTLAPMPRKARLDLFVQLARAVDAAHTVGVLHKDLKPANILVRRVVDETGPSSVRETETETETETRRTTNATGEWQLRVIDFGNGRLLDSGPASAGSAASQALGFTITTRGTPDGTDHLGLSTALGGTFYYMAPELHSGHAPTVRSDVYALGLVLLQLLVGDLRRTMASGWEAQIEDELLVEDIRQATQGDPQRRTASAAALADQIQMLDARHAQEAVRRAAKAASERLQQEAALRRARRPWMLSGIAALGLSLVASLWFSRQASLASRQSQRQAEQALALNDFLTKDVLQAPDMVMTGGSKVPTLLDVLRRAAAHAAEHFKGQPELEAAARQHLARVFQRIVSNTDADRQYSAAIRLLEPRVPADDARLLTVRYEYVRLLLEMSHPSAAKEQFEIAERQVSPTALGQSTALALLAARARLGLFGEVWSDKDVVAAAQRFKELGEKVPNLDPAMRSEATLELAFTFLKRGNEPAAMEALTSLRETPTEAEATRALLLGRLLTRKAVLARDAGHFDEAERVLLESRAALLRSPRPSQLHLGYVEIERAEILRLAKRMDEAAQAYQAARKTFLNVLGDDHQNTQITTVNLAWALCHLGQLQEALDLAMSVRPWFIKHATNGIYPPLETLVPALLVGLHRPAEALEILQKLPGGKIDALSVPADAEAAQIQAYTGLALIESGKVDLGTTLVHRASAMLEAEAKSGGELLPWVLVRVRAVMAGEREQTASTSSLPNAP